MTERIMYVQLKTGHDTDAGPAWIAKVNFNRTWKTLRFHGRTLRRMHSGMDGYGRDANFYDMDSGEMYWVSGPKRDRTDGRYSSLQPLVDADARADYEAFLAGGTLPGRDRR